MIVRKVFKVPVHLFSYRQCLMFLDNHTINDGNMQIYTELFIIYMSTGIDEHDDARYQRTKWWRRNKIRVRFFWVNLRQKVHDLCRIYTISTANNKPLGRNAASQH